jgi:dTDP-4-amino-4,6-dideoxygalactose transaminase
VREVLSLPLHPYLSEAAIDAVCAAVEDFPA